MNTSDSLIAAIVKNEAEIETLVSGNTPEALQTNLQLYYISNPNIDVAKIVIYKKLNTVPCIALNIIGCDGEGESLLISGEYLPCPNNPIESETPPSSGDGGSGGVGIGGGGSVGGGVGSSDIVYDNVPPGTGLPPRLPVRTVRTTPPINIENHLPHID